MTIKPKHTEEDHVPAMDAALRAYFQEHKTQHTLSQQAMQRLLQNIPDESRASQQSKASQYPILSWMRWLLLPLSATAGFLLLWGPFASQTLRLPSRKQTIPTQERILPPTLRGVAKGGALSVRLLYARKTLEGFVHKHSADTKTTLLEGDIVQFSYHAPHPMHLMVVSVNRKGDVSLYLPFEQAQSLAIPAGKGFFPPDSSLVLDEYQGLELFLFFSAQKPFSFQRIQSTLKQAYQNARGQLGKLTLPKGPWKVETLLLQKAARNR